MRRFFMEKDQLSRSILSALENHGYKGRIVSVARTNDLKREIEEKHNKDQIDERLYKDYLLDFNFDNPALQSEADSLIVVATPQPAIRVKFSLNERTFPCLIPSTYCHATDVKAQKILEALLNPHGFNVQRRVLPYKLLAVRSGFARYGRNNIAYVDEMGSYFRLSAFYSNLPCFDDEWVDPKIHDLCQDCSACFQACPTGAIPEDGFLLQAERCITFHNESQRDFPRWIEPSWHNCLVGCLHCQRVCPINNNFIRMVEQGPSFTHHETEALLEGRPIEKIPPEIKIKLEQLDLIEYAEILGRNLRALMRKE